MKTLQIIQKISFVLCALSLLCAFLTMSFSLLSGIKGDVIVSIIGFSILGTILFFGIEFLLIDEIEKRKVNNNN